MQLLATEAEEQAQKQKDKENKPSWDEKKNLGVNLVLL